MHLKTQVLQRMARVTEAAAVRAAAFRCHVAPTELSTKMTSYTKKLYVRNPAAAKLIAQTQQFEHRLVYGKHTQLASFTPAWNPVAKAFGRRISPPSAVHACRERCGHPACAKGCVLFVQQGS